MKHRENCRWKNFNVDEGVCNCGEDFCMNCGHNKYKHEGLGFTKACLDCIPARKCKKFSQFQNKEKEDEN
ncbi:hypothetical protein LCGC14_2358630 [marine sediment metagenome]|uniref:Uncharacterized protein n=1 Tax=marine sediment metagenome TaxID=412755 RepID=A0A0F9CUJ3_9ZZZZ